MQLEVIYEDNHLLVVNKPGGLATQKHGEEKGLECVALDYLHTKFLEPIHRLDKPASGIVIFAKTSKALSRLQQQMREKKIKKTYYARVEGVPKQTSASLRHYLTHDEYRANVTTKKDPKAKEALLDYIVVSCDEKSALLEIQLHTGRYHQIRAQLAAIGHPIIGDKKYGAHKNLETIALTHVHVSFIHPVTKQSVSCQVSQYMQK